MEAECGLTEYAVQSDASPIKCELKRLYSDFIVNEILTDGTLALSSESGPSKEDSAAAKCEGPAPKRPTFFSDEDCRKIEEVAKGTLESHSIPSKDLSKDERREVHEYIRNSHPRKLCSNGRDGEIVIKPSAAADKNERKRQAWPSDRPDYLHFTMTKENKDTQYALNVISRLSGLNQKVFGIAGTKDRRAITSQRVSAYRVEIQRIKKLKPQLRGIVLSGFGYSDHELKLGDLWGNRFSIVLRGIDPSLKERLEERLAKWKDAGFINYFGTQRFGSCGSLNVEAGRRILTQKWKEAVETILQPRSEATGSLKSCLEKYAETQDPQLALKELKGGVSYATVEATLLKSLARQPNGFKNAIMSLPRNMRSLYVHAYQSCVFNVIASRRARQFGLKVLEGDVSEEGAELSESSTVYDVALPLPSAKPTMPRNEVAKWYAEISTTDGVTEDAFEQLQKDFALGQVLRKFVEKPRDVSWEFLTYKHRSEPLQPGLFQLCQQAAPSNKVVLGKQEPTSDKCEPAPLTAVEENDQPPEPAVKTEVEEATEESDEPVLDSADPEGKPNADDSGLALKVEFSLPAGCYATVALRELLRTDFSKAAQKAQFSTE